MLQVGHDAPNGIGDTGTRWNEDTRDAEFARQIDVPPNRISQIIAGKRSITGDTALRFGHWFGTDPQFWLNLQAQFELVQADRETGATIRHLPTKDALPPRDAQPRLV